MLSFSNPRELEVVVRGATEGESWVDDVQEGLKALLSAEAAAAAPQIQVSEEAKAATMAAQQRYQEVAAQGGAQGPPQGPPQGLPPQ